MKSLTRPELDALLAVALKRGLENFVDTRWYTKQT